MRWCEMQLTGELILHRGDPKHGLQNEAGHLRNGEDMKDKPTAFDDRELSDWLMDLIVDGPQDFLSALAEVAVTADAEDYGVIRPALVEFRRNYCDQTRKRVAGRRFVATKRTPTETQSERGQPQ
jgi:hypothetical protein